MEPHRLWAECKARVAETCRAHLGVCPVWTERACTFNPLFVIGIVYDMHKCGALPPVCAFEEALEAELVSIRVVLSRPLEDFVSMLYTKGYIPPTWDPLDISALSLMARRVEASPDETFATLCRVFLRTGEAAPRGSASRLVCDALRRSGPARHAHPAKRARRPSPPLEEYDPCNAQMAPRAVHRTWDGFGGAPLPAPPPLGVPPGVYAGTGMGHGVALDTHALNALVASLLGGQRAM